MVLHTTSTGCGCMGGSIVKVVGSVAALLWVVEGQFAGGLWVSG